MGRPEREALKNRIVNYYLKISDNDKSATVKHFKAENIPESTIYSIIQTYERNKTFKDLPRCGRPRKLGTREVKRLVNSFKNRDGKSLRVEAKKFSVCHKTISNYLTRNKVQHRKKERAPLVTSNQLEKITRTSRKLATKTFVGKSVVMDDEKYFTYGNSSVAGNDGYYTNDKSTTPDDVRFQQKSKFEPKVLMWIAISEKGISQPYFQESSTAITSETYINKCLRPRLIPYLKRNYNQDDYVFWPDLASAHYSKTTTDFLNANLVNFVEKHDNPPNVPQARPIENFWALLSSRVYKHGWRANSKPQLIRRIKKMLKEVTENELQGLFKDLRGKLRKISDKGPYSVFK